MLNSVQKALSKGSKRQKKRKTNSFSRRTHAPSLCLLPFHLLLKWSQRKNHSNMRHSRKKRKRHLEIRGKPDVLSQLLFELHVFVGSHLLVPEKQQRAISESTWIKRVELTVRFIMRNRFSNRSVVFFSKIHLRA